MMRHAITLASLLVAACGPSDPSPVCRDTPSASTNLLDPARLLVVADDRTVHIEGRARTTEPGARITLGSNETHADDTGAFTLSGLVDDTALTMTHAEQSETVTVSLTTYDDALRCTVGAPYETGTLPNDIALLTCDGRLHVAVVLSAEGAVDVFDASGTRRDASPLFPVQDGLGAQPFSLAVIDGGPRALVTLFGQHAVALVDLCAGRLLDVAEVRDLAGDLVRIELTTPILLSASVDADRDGASESVVTRYAPRHPQGVAVVGADAFVTFTNHLEPATTTRDQVLAPGTLARFHVDGESLVSDGHLVLEGALNPQAIVATARGLLVSSSGPFARGSATLVAADGALTFVDGGALVATRRIDTGRFAPARPAFVAERIVVGSLLRPEILVVSPDALSFHEGVTLHVDGPTTESMFDAAPLGDDLVLVTAFTGDRLHVVDLRTTTVDPWPFSQGIAVAEPASVFRGALAVDVTKGAPGRATGAALLGLSSEVVWLTFSGLFGP